MYEYCRFSISFATGAARAVEASARAMVARRDCPSIVKSEAVFLDSEVGVRMVANETIPASPKSAPALYIVFIGNGQLQRTATSGTSFKDTRAREDGRMPVRMSFGWP